MDSHFLYTFVRVVELGSIAEASRRLDLTPATVAQRLRTLETELQTRLVSRTGRTVKATVAGERVMARALAVLREVRDLKSAASGTDLPAGPLRLGATPTAMAGALPALLKKWVARYSQIEIYIEPGSTSVLRQQVMRGDLDAAILVLPSFDLPKTIVWRTMREEPLVLVTPRSMKVRTPLETLSTQPYIRYDRSVIGGRLAEAYLQKNGVVPKVRFELDGIENISRLVAHGLGVSVLPDWTDVADRTVVKWPLPAPCPSRTVGMMWARAGVRAPLAQAFADLI